MMQFVALAVAFICLFLLLRRRVEFGVAICVAAGVLGLLTAGGPMPFLEKSIRVLTAKTALQTMAAVLFVGILSGVCRHYGILDKIVDNLKLIITNPRINLILVPAIIGLLPVPGGASVSVPFVDTIATDYEVSAGRKAAINMVFRHAGMLLMPFSTTVIIALDILKDHQVTYLELSSRTVLFVVGNMLLGYLCLLRDIPARPLVMPVGDRSKGLVNLLINLSPIISVVLVTFVFETPIFISVAVGIGIAFLISNKKDFPAVVLKATNPKLMLTIAGINLMQGFIQDLDQVIGTLTGSLGTGIGALVAYALTSAFLSLITGTSLTPLGIVLPLVAAIPQSHGMLLANTFLIFTASYLGYFYSPLHLCQVLTLDYLKCDVPTLFREYRLYVMGMLVVSIGGYGLFTLLA